jgi:spoIIIJ-associated protein
MTTAMIHSLIQELLTKLFIEIRDISIQEDKEINATILMIQTPDSKLLIGRGGETLRAFNFLVRKIVEEKMGKEAQGNEFIVPNFIIDVDGFHTKKINELKMKARIVADRARTFRRTVELEPMSPYYRLLIHSFLAQLPNIKTESTGQGRDRRVTVSYISDDGIL